MKDSQNQKESEKVAERHILQTILLIFLESLLTFLLKTDRGSRQVAKTLIQRRAVIEVRTYLPAENFYASFTNKGVLLDFDLPASCKVDGVVTASSPDMLRAFMSAPASVLEKIRVEGDADVVSDLRHLMHIFNVQHIFSSWWQGLWFSKNAEERPIKESARIRRLNKRVEGQQQQLDQVNLQLRESQYALKQLQYRHQRMMWSMAMLIVALLAVVGYLIF